MFTDRQTDISWSQWMNSDSIKHKQELNLAMETTNCTQLTFCSLSESKSEPDWECLSPFAPSGRGAGGVGGLSSSPSASF